ncbi:MAG: dephospho-CoA kinase [Bacteroidetes bacterium]|nr:MAG: dephospho-CoA kinase [Bacteroidota bacterium]
MLKLGITGGIGSGKSTVCEIFKSLNIPIYSADDRAKALMTEDRELIKAVKALFGEEAYTADGSLNRALIASIVFQDAAKLEALNAAVHPAVFRDFARWSAEQTSPYVIKEAALMFESGSFRDLDYVVTVSAPQQLRIERSMKRDNTSAEAIKARMKKQWSEKQRLEAADFVIQNDGKHQLIPQVLELHQKMLFAAGL